MRGEKERWLTLKSCALKIETYNLLYVLKLRRVFVIIKQKPAPHSTYTSIYILRGVIGRTELDYYVVVSAE